MVKGKANTRTPFKGKTLKESQCFTIDSLDDVQNVKAAIDKAAE